MNFVEFPLAIRMKSRMKFPEHEFSILMMLQLFILSYLHCVGVVNDKLFIQFNLILF